MTDRGFCFPPRSETKAGYARVSEEILLAFANFSHIIPLIESRLSRDHALEKLKHSLVDHSFIDRRERFELPLAGWRKSVWMQVGHKELLELSKGPQSRFGWIWGKRELDWVPAREPTIRVSLHELWRRSTAPPEKALRDKFSYRDL